MIRNSLTIDVEEYFHPTEVQALSDAGASLPPRIEQVMGSILDTLEEHDSKVTCFILGWVAERYPRLIEKIHRAGHEIGCHSYAHRLVYHMTPEEFRRDTMLAMRLIEDACGVVPRLYRAPSYSITKDSLWALDVLADLGFTHDSSIYPIKHDRYGIPGFERQAHLRHTSSGSIYEVPIATVELPNGAVAPVGGGAYLRLLPYRYTAAGIRRINEKDGKPACIYFHPWELDPAQPRLPLGLVGRLRTYTGLSSMPKKIEMLIQDFEFGTLSEVYPLPAKALAATAVRMPAIPSPVQGSV